MKVLPPALEDLITAFAKLPGVGPRTAERYAYFIVRNKENLANELSDSLINVSNNVAYCQKTFALVPKGQKYSDIYTDPRRDKKTVAVVAEPFDILALEKTKEYSGTYHVLGGLISPIDGLSIEQLHIKELIKRIKDDSVKEVILALNASVEGESTSIYIAQQLNEAKVKVTRLARGLPIGVDLEYADQITLQRALENRQSI